MDTYNNTTTVYQQYKQYKTTDKNIDWYDNISIF